MSDSDDDDEGLDLSDPLLEKCACFGVALFVVLGVLVASQTTIFDKMKGRPLNSQDAIIAAVVLIVGGILLCCCVSTRMRNTRQRARLLRDEQHQDAQELEDETVAIHRSDVSSV